MSVKQKLISFFGVLGKFLAVLFSEALHRELIIVVPLARQIIAEVAADPALLSSADKRNAAIVRIGGKLAAQQLAIGQDVIRFAIELAYQDFKSAPEAAPVAPTTKA